MREAAANLEFEEAARLRDEVKRLRQVEMAIMDDPLARQSQVEDRAGRYEGERRNSYVPQLGVDSKETSGDDAGLPGSRIAGRAPETMKERKFGERGISTKAASRPHKPTLDEMGPHAERPLPGAKPKPSRPAPDLRTFKPGNTVTVEDSEPERRGKRRRPVKTGRPGT